MEAAVWGFKLFPLKTATDKLKWIMAPGHVLACLNFPLIPFSQCHVTSNWTREISDPFKQHR